MFAPAATLQHYLQYLGQAGCWSWERWPSAAEEQSLQAVEEAQSEGGGSFITFHSYTKIAK